MSKLKFNIEEHVNMETGFNPNLKLIHHEIILKNGKIFKISKECNDGSMSMEHVLFCELLILKEKCNGK